MIYELTYLITPKLTDEEAEKFESKIGDLIKKAGAEIKEKEDPVRKDLAYEIEKERAAYLASVIFVTEPKTVKKIEESLKKDDKIIRHLLISRKHFQKEEKKEKKSSEKKEDKVKLKEIDDKIEEII